MKHVKNPDQEYLKEMFNYDGVNLIWKVNKNNRRSVLGQIAGNVTKDGYIKIGLDRVTYMAHRLIYVWYHGGNIDNLDVAHKNSICADNRIENLVLINHNDLI